jgi:hypothetical protein
MMINYHKESFENEYEIDQCMIYPVADMSITATISALNRTPPGVARSDIFNTDLVLSEGGLTYFNNQRFFRYPEDTSEQIGARVFFGNGDDRSHHLHLFADDDDFNQIRKRIGEYVTIKFTSVACVVPHQSDSKKAFCLVSRAPAITKFLSVNHNLKLDSHHWDYACHFIIDLEIEDVPSKFKNGIINFLNCFFKVKDKNIMGSGAILVKKARAGAFGSGGQQNKDGMATDRNGKVLNSRQARQQNGLMPFKFKPPGG